MRDHYNRKFIRNRHYYRYLFIVEQYFVKGKSLKDIGKMFNRSSVLIGFWLHRAIPILARRNGVLSFIHDSLSLPQLKKQYGDKISTAIKLNLKTY